MFLHKFFIFSTPTIGHRTTDLSPNTIGGRTRYNCQALAQVWHPLHHTLVSLVLKWNITCEAIQTQPIRSYMIFHTLYMQFPHSFLFILKPYFKMQFWVDTKINASVSTNVNQIKFSREKPNFKIIFSQVALYKLFFLEWKENFLLNVLCNYNYS